MRASGILLPISSIPSPHGIGCFDRNAYRFVDTLVSCGQKYWQILPMGPTGYGELSVPVIFDICRKSVLYFARRVGGRGAFDGGRDRSSRP